MSALRNSGIWLFCGIVCIWPLIVTVIGIALDRRIRAGGLDSLIPPRWRKQA